MAWAHICALRALEEDDISDGGKEIDGKRIGGKVFFVSDDTPRTNMFEFCEPFLKLNGYLFHFNKSKKYYIKVILTIFNECINSLFSKNKIITNKNNFYN